MSQRATVVATLHSLHPPPLQCIACNDVHCVHCTQCMQRCNDKDSHRLIENSPPAQIHEVPVKNMNSYIGSPVDPNHLLSA